MTGMTDDFSDSSNSSVTIALAQIDTCVGDLDGNAAKVLSYSRRAAGQGADVVLFPEMTLTGYPIEDLAFRATFRQAAWDKASTLAEDLGKEGLGDLYVVVGTVAADAHGLPRNRLIVLHQGVVEASYDKHFLPNYGVFDEFRIFSPGDLPLVMTIKGRKIGFAICEDIWQEGGPVAQLAQKGIDLLATINGSPYEEGKGHVRTDLCARRAREVTAPVIYLNQVGGQDDLVFDGASFVVNPDGGVEERSPQFVEDLSFWTLPAVAGTDSDQAGRSTLTPLMDSDEEVYRACVLGLKDYMAKNGFKGVVLGLSGGIDSALVATMAADAIGGSNVWGLSMPSMYSSSGSKDDAADLAANLGAHYEIQPLNPSSKPSRNSWICRGSRPKTSRRGCVGSWSWPTRTPTASWPWPPGTSPNWPAVIPPSMATRWAVTPPSRTSSKPRSGSWRSGAIPMRLAKVRCRRFRSIPSSNRLAPSCARARRIPTPCLNTSFWTKSWLLISRRPMAGLICSRTVSTRRRWIRSCAWSTRPNGSVASTRSGPR